MTDHVNNLRSFRGANEPIYRGHPAPIQNNVTLRDDFKHGLGLGIICFVVSFIALVMFRNYLHLGLSGAFERAFTIGFWATCLYFSYPLLACAIYILKNFKWMDRAFIDRFAPMQKLASVFTIAYFLVHGFNYGYPYAVNAVQHTAVYFKQATSSTENAKGAEILQHKKDKKSKVKYAKQKRGTREITEHMPLQKRPIRDVVTFFAAWVAFAAVLAFLLPISWRNPSFSAPKVKKPKKSKSKPEDLQSRPFGLWLGVSTGWLAKIYHGTGIAANQDVVLDLQDAAQNILVLGSIGSGKTTSAIHPLLVQLLDQGCGGLIFDIKGDFQSAVLEFAKQAKRNLTVIGPKYQKINLLAGLTPEMAASFLKSVFTLNSPNRLDSFWIDTATELCRNTLGILSFVKPHYSLLGLHGYIFNLEHRITIDQELKTRLNAFNEVEKRLLNSYWQYYEQIFDKFEEKVKAGVNATIAQVLSPFNHPALVDTFCTEHESNIKMEDVLNGAVCLVELPLATWGLGGKVVYTLLKLRFFNVMQRRTSNPDWEQEKPVFFMCDEFQEIVSANKDGISDLNFWDKSRSSKTIGIISAQAVSSFYAAIGDRDTANALLQNFRQKICFRTEDPTTLNYFYDLAAKVEVTKITESWTSGESRQGFLGHTTTSDSHTHNKTYVDKPVLDAQLFRSLDKNQAVALLSIDGQSMDDVINTWAVYV